MTQRLAGLHHQSTIPMGQSLDQGEHMAAVHAAQHIAYHCFGQSAVAKRDGLVGQGQSVAHGSPSGTGQQAQRLHIGLHLLVGQHLRQVFDDGLRRHGPQIELQTAR